MARNNTSGTAERRDRQLGMVMRFRPGSAPDNIRGMAAQGLRVATSSDFRSAASIPNDFDGADVQYFERFGIAISRGDGDRIGPMVQRARASQLLVRSRPERLYHAISGGVDLLAKPSFVDSSVIDESRLDRGYLRGYRDAINQLVDRLLVEPAHAASIPAMAMSEKSATWGLQATKVASCRYSGAGIKVAVLDTGFDETHPDFVGRTVHKKSFVTRSSDEDIVGHGTHCIGTACGPRKPHTHPRYGVAYDAEIYAGKVLGDDGFGSDRSIIAGMEWALEEGCHIISMSLGAGVRLGDKPAGVYEQIGQVCLDSGLLVVAAAGNESERPGTIAPVGSPANASTILAVAAVDSQMRIADFSCGTRNPGQDVDIAAPGVDILSTLPGGEFDRWDGTSMATPHVAGIAALIAESNAQLRGKKLWDEVLRIALTLKLPRRDAGVGLVQAP